jgi:hypothetical protein
MMRVLPFSAQKDFGLNNIRPKSFAIYNQRVAQLNILIGLGTMLSNSFPLTTKLANQTKTHQAQT